MDIPECPITKAPLRNPVMDPEGNTYEKSAIIAWLQQHGTSPITRTPLSANQLVPNRALKDLIDEKEKESKRDVSSLGKFTGKYNSDPIAEGEIKFEAVTLLEQNATAFVIEGPNSNSTFPVHVCCVIDVSGSMGSLVSDKGENDGLTLLDLVKHSTRVIIESLGPHDKCSIITFSSDSKCVFAPTLMNDKGKEKARDALEALHTEGSTNLAAGIVHALNVCSQVDTSFFSSIFVLTDGVPDDSTFDYVGAMKRQKKKGRFFGNLNTFGFGYSLDSQILRRIATEGKGCFGFIPDGGMVGTIFINALANLRTCYAVETTLTITPAHELTVEGYFETQLLENDSLCVHLGPLKFGQKTVVVVNKPGLSATLSARSFNNKEICKRSERGHLSEDEQAYEAYRAKMSTAMFAACEMSFDKVKSIADNFKVPATIAAKKSLFSPLNALCKDIEGQVAEAISRKDWFDRWGRHYLISLGFAHSRQVCNNFKDSGVQEYGKGVLFQQFKDDLSDMFISLPAPNPTGHVGHYNSSSGSAPVQVNMGRYYDSNAGCFHGDGKVETIDGEIILVSQLRKGMVLANGAKVKCLIETKVKKGCFMVKIGNLLITPFHPVRINASWIFPEYASQPTFVKCKSVFNLVLDSKHIVSIDNVECVTLGHDFKGDVVQHSFFGSQKVIEALRKCQGWSEGKVVLDENSLKRDDETGLIADLKPVDNPYKLVEIQF